jgi:hypothetical protein
MTALAKTETFCLTSRHADGSPMVWGAHALTWVQLFPGVWFLAQMEKV